MKKKLLLLLFSLGLNIAAFACSCSFGGTFVKVAKTSDLVVMAKITGKSSGKLKAEISKSLLGQSADENITINGDTNGDSCYEVLNNYNIGETYAFALKKDRGGLYLSGCGEYSLKLESGQLKGMVTDEFTTQTEGGWPQWNKKTMDEAAFYTLFSEVQLVLPCRQANFAIDANTEALKSKTLEAKTIHQNGKAPDYWAYKAAIEDNNQELLQYYISNTELLTDARLPDLVLTAAEKGNIDLVKLFLANGVSPNLHDNSKFYLIYKAVLYPEILQLLHKAGAELDVKGYGGSTALMHAAREGCLDSITYLMQNGADPEAKNESGYRPYDFAKRFNNRNKAEAVKLLKAK